MPDPIVCNHHKNRCRTWLGNFLFQRSSWSKNRWLRYNSTQTGVEHFLTLFFFTVWSSAAPFLASVPGISNATAQVNNMTFTFNFPILETNATDYEDIARQIVTANPDVLMRMITKLEALQYSRNLHILCSCICWFLSCSECDSN